MEDYGAGYRGFRPTEQGSLTFRHGRNIQREDALRASARA
jgi:hypothetical protein